MNLLTKEKLTHRLCEQAYGCQREALGEGIVWKFWMGMNTLLYLKWKPTRTYFIAHGTLLNVMWQPGLEESLGENGYILYRWLSPFAVHWKLSQYCLLICYIPIQK